MRVIIYTNRSPQVPIGGIERFLNELTQTLDTHGIEVNFILCNLSTSNSKLFARKADIEFYKQALLAKHCLLASKCDEDISNHENINHYIEVVNSYDLFIVAGSASLLFNQPFLFKLLSNVFIPTFFILLYPLAEIEYYFGPIIRNAISQIISKCVNACDCLIVPSRYVKEEIDNYCDIVVPVVQIPHGINLQSLQTNSYEETTLKDKRAISISRLAEHKNIELLLEAWRLVNKRIPEAKLTLVGTASFLDKQKGISGVRCAGKVTDEEKINLLRESRVFVLASSIEAFGLTFLEALSNGVPVIGLRSTATVELIKHEINGLLVEPVELQRQLPESLITCNKPDISQLSSAIIRLMIDDNLQKRLAEACLESSSHYDWHLVVKKYLDLYDMLSYSKTSFNMLMGR